MLILILPFNPWQIITIIVTMAKPDKSGLDSLFRRHGSEANSRNLANDAIAVCVPAGHCVIQCGEKGEEHQHEEETQKGVVDDIEDRNLH